TPCCGHRVLSGSSMRITFYVYNKMSFGTCSTKSRIRTESFPRTSLILHRKRKILFEFMTRFIYTSVYEANTMQSLLTRRRLLWKKPPHWIQVTRSYGPSSLGFLLTGIFSSPNRIQRIFKKVGPTQKRLYGWITPANTLTKHWLGHIC